MRVALDASRTTSATPTGTEHYARALLRALITLNDTLPQPHALHLCFREAPPPDLFPASPHTTPHVLRARSLWTHTAFAAALALLRPHVTFVPAHTLPWLFPGPGVVTVHDLGYRHFPDTHRRWPRAYLNASTAHSARRARVILADSHATARDLAQFYHVAAAKVRVVYPGLDAPPVGDLAAVRAKHRLPERYWLFVGTLQPRKNIDGLLAAYAQWRTQAPPDAALVLAGAPGWLVNPAWAAADGVIALGYVAEADKGALYAGALGLVFPSWHEGFGFPLLEAMACGCPVIASSTSSLPELAGDAALLADPADPAAFAAAMRRLDADPPLRATLVTRGRAQAARFTWAATAQGLLGALEEAAHGR